MSTWILIFYMSTNIGRTDTGGPAAVNGLQSKAQCEKLLETVSQVKKFDWGQCVEVRP